MGKIHPKTSMIMTMSSVSSNCDHHRSSSKTELIRYTIWMKSLVMHGNGCTVFNSNGDVVFRVDNYQTTQSSQVFFMNSNGHVLFSIKRKNLFMMMLRSWEGYKWKNNSKLDDKEGEWFQVKRKTKHNPNKKSGTKCLKVIVGFNKTAINCYDIVSDQLEGKSTVKIVDRDDGRVLAVAMQKQSSADGVCLGDDVLTLSVEPQIDHALIMALVVVHGLINHKL